MITIIISWLLLFIVFTAFGDMMVLLWGKMSKKQETYSTIDRIWIGLCTLGVVLLYSSILLPIDITSLSVVLVLTIIYIAFRRRYFKDIFCSLKQQFLKQKLLYSIFFVATILFAIAAPFSYDLGLYHLQTLQWNETFKVVHGLGNLHGRLGFNSSFLLLSTLFNYHPSYYTPVFSINSFATLTFSFWIVSKLVKKELNIQKLGLIFVLLVVFLTMGKFISSASTDILPNILILYILLSCAINFEDFSNKALLIALLPAMCITMKLSSAPILLITAFYIVYFIRKKETKIAVWLILLGIIVAIPWLIRFVILTGYLVYPFASIDIFSVDWKMPINMVVWEQEAAYSWAKIPNLPSDEVLGMSFSKWFPIWLQARSVPEIVIYALALLSPVFMLIMPLKNKINILPWTIGYAGCIFGFLTAPDPRFTLGFIISASIIPLLHIKPSLFNTEKILKLACTSVGLLIILAASRHLIYLQSHSTESSFNLSHSPQSINLLQPEISFSEHKINHITIYVPNETNQCFDQAIPCMPYQGNNLELRGNDIQDGFRIKKQ